MGIAFLSRVSSQVFSRVSPRVSVRVSALTGALCVCVSASAGLPGASAGGRPGSPPQPASFKASTQTADDVQLQACARGELVRWLASQRVRFELEPVANAAPIALPVGQVGFVARPVDAKQPLSARMQVWVDVSVDGRFVRTQPVALRVRAYRAAWLATEDVAVGHDVPTAPFESREIDIAAVRSLPIDGPLPMARLRLRLLKGEPLTASHLERLPAVQRGGNVTLRARLGEIGIESRGEALQDGEPGQRVWVKVTTSTGPVLAQVVGAGVVEMQP